MDWRENPIVKAYAYATAHPIEAAQQRRREEEIHRLAFVLGRPSSVVEDVAPRLCEDLGLSLEGLYRKLAAGDEAAWEKAEAYCRQRETE